MRKLFFCSAVSLVAIVGTAVGQAAKAPAHILMTAAETKWGEPPPVFEKGMSFAVLSGDPGKGASSLSA